LLDHPEPRARINALKVLAKLGVKAMAVAPLVLRCHLEVENRDLRNEAYSALKKLVAVRARESFVKQELSDESDIRVLEVAGKASLFEAMEKHDRDRVKALALLSLKSSDEGARRAANEVVHDLSLPE